MHKNFINIVNYISNFSDDPHRKVGAIIIDDNKNIISTGYNDIPKNCEKKPERYSKELKYLWIVHAEESAILNAVYNGISLKNTTMYINWFPCAKCAGQIINSGIKKIICSESPDFNHVKYGEEFKISLEKLTEANVSIEIIKNNE
jgi:dCMP deaminase